MDRRRILAREDLADIALRGRIEAAAYVETEAAEVTAPLAPFLSSPDAPGLSAQLRMGDRLRIAERRGAMVWARRGRDGYVGWTEAAALGPVAEGPRLRVTAPLAHLYPVPDIKTVPAALLPMGAAVVETGLCDDPAFVAVPGGFLRRAALAAVAGDAAAVAETLIGAPYLWGGESALGIDCSGLVQLALEAVGTAAPRDSDMQAAETGAALENPWAGGDPAAPMPALQRGDLVFWRGHVGMMLDASRLIHANAHHMRVAVEPLAEAIARIAAGTGGAGRGAGLPVALRRV